MKMKVIKLYLNPWKVTSVFWYYMSQTCTVKGQDRKGPFWRLFLMWVVWCAAHHDTKQHSDYFPLL